LTPNLDGRARTRLTSSQTRRAACSSRARASAALSRRRPQARAAPCGINRHPAQFDGRAAVAQAGQDGEARQVAVIVGDEVLLIGVGQGALVPGHAGLSQPPRGVRACLQRGHASQVCRGAGPDADAVLHYCLPPGKTAISALSR
jgi:hypothetical protein